MTDGKKQVQKNSTDYLVTKDEYEVDKLVARFKRTRTLEDVQNIRDEIYHKIEIHRVLTYEEKLLSRAVKIFLSNSSQHTQAERENIFNIAKKNAIRVLNDGKPNNKNRARNQMLCDCIQSELVRKNSHTYDILLYTETKKIDENWINSFS